MVLEHIRQASHADITHIPYKGGGQQLTDALAGHFEVLSTNVSAMTIQHVQSGKFKPLAVGAPARLSVLPDVPTLAELGYPQANLSSLFGIFAPGKTPVDIVQRLNLEVNAILRQPDFQDRLTSVNNVPTLGGATEFAHHIATESRHNARIIAVAQIKMD
jgi:tripartite-type tricarboxylate transporter receptor subunit TctC